MRIRRYLIILAVIASIPLFIFNILGYQADIAARKRSILELDLGVAKTLAGAFQSFILQAVRQQETAGLALIGGFSEEEAGVRYLRAVRDTSPRMRSIAFAEPDGTITLSTGGRSGRMPGLKRLRGRTFWVSDLRRSRKKKAVFRVIVRIEDNGRTAGFVDAVFDTDVVHEVLAGENRAADVHLSITDATGRAAALSFRENPTWSQRDRRKVPMVRQASRGKTAVSDRFYDPLLKTYAMGAATPIEPIGWSVMVFEPADKVLGPVRQAALQSLLGSAVASLAVLVIILLLGNTLINPIIKLAQETTPLRQGKFEHRVATDYRLFEIKELAKSINAAIVTIQRSFDTEHHIAASLQTGLLPVSPPRLDGYSIGTHYSSATERALVGGDFFDFQDSREENLLIAVGDAQGKGVEAALSTAMIKFTLRELTLDKSLPPDRVVEQLNNISPRSAPDQLITLILVLLEKQSGLIQYVSAGHHPPLICHEQACRFLPIVNEPALGVVENFKYRLLEDRLMPGDSLVLYTDGVVEARRDSVLFGHDRLQRLVATHHDQDPTEITRKIYEACLDFSDGNLRDDLAVVVVKRHA